MKKRLLSGLAICVLAQGAHAITVSNESEFGQSIGLWWGEDLSLPAVSVGAQTFSTPSAEETRLTDFSFWFHNLLGKGSFYYDFVVAEWDQSILKPVVEVFRQKQRWDSVESNGWVEVGISGESIDLDASKGYVAILDGTPYQDESIYLENTTSMSMSVGAVFDAGGGISGGLYSGNFLEDSSAVINGSAYNAGSSSHYDLAYAATFVDPSALPDKVPSSGSSLLFLASGLLAVFAFKRRVANS